MDVPGVGVDVDMFCPVSVRPWIFCFDDSEARPTHQGITHSSCLTNPTASHPPKPKPKPKPTRRGGRVCLTFLKLSCRNRFESPSS